jgi:SpoVK/Ycf46/Vps4 family AAA+-type ATPase
MSELIDSLAAAVAGRPDDVPLRLHLVGLLLDAGRQQEAISHAAQALQYAPANAEARELMARAIGSAAPAAATPPAEPATATPPTATPPADPAADGGMDWRAYEEQLSDVIPPRFARADSDPDPVLGDADRRFDVEQSTLRLADVGGMVEVKRRLELAFLGPLRNPQLRTVYGKSLRGGLLLYGPPGCGKTFLARAVAGEMGARFIPLSIVDVLNMWIGNSEKNLHEIFEAARRNAPCVVFLDEIDALGHKRSQLHSSAMRTLGNQLLAELDGMEGNNEGVFVLAATNAPWDVDAALRRPGRLDRVALVLPPDPPARAAILEYHLRNRPIARVDLKRLVGATEHFSGADLAHLCETAAEHAMADSIESGSVRMIEQSDFEQALREIRPSTAPWFAAARNVALFANEGGTYDELASYLKKRKLL